MLEIQEFPDIYMNVLLEKNYFFSVPYISYELLYPVSFHLTA